MTPHPSLSVGGGNPRSKLLSNVLVTLALSAQVVAGSTPAGLQDRRATPMRAAAKAVGASESIVFLKGDVSGSGPTKRISQALASINPTSGVVKTLSLEVADAFPAIHVAAQAPLVLYVRPIITPNGEYGPEDDVVLHNIVTSESKVVLKLPHGTQVSELASDGSKFAYAETDRSDTDYGCCVKRIVVVSTSTGAKMPVEGRVTPRLKTIPGLPNNFATGRMQFSPDGQWLGVRRTYYKTWPHAALLIRLDSGITRQLGEGSDASLITDIGNDKVLYTVTNSSDGPIDLLAFDLKTTASSVVAKGGYLGKLSPNGRNVAYFTDGPKSGGMPTQDLWVVGDGTPARLVARHVAGEVSWSPNGELLVYTAFPADPSGPSSESLWIVSRDGGDTNRLLTSGNFNAASKPSWIRY